MEKELKSFQSVDANATLGEQISVGILDIAAAVFIVAAISMAIIKLIIEIKNDI